MDNKSFMNTTSHITIPCHWNITILEKIQKQQNIYPDTQITEVYGTPISGVIGVQKFKLSI